MKFTVMYALKSHDRDYPTDWPTDWLAEYNDAIVMRAYLAQRGIKFYNLSCGTVRGGFIIDYASPAHRTATELVMSGCKHSCTIEASKELPC